MTTWFTSDLHLGHANIIKHCNRPFVDLYTMDTNLIKNWNKKVNPDDTVLCLGDLTLSTHVNTVNNYINSLNGFIILVKGNHDKWVKKYTPSSKVTVVEYYEATFNNQLYVMSHYPFQTWNRSYRGSIHLHGHCHGKLGVVSAPNRLDVGVDCHDYTPIDLKDIRKLLAL